MINKIAFTPAMSIAEAPEKEVNFKGLPKEETKEDNSALLYGSLAVLGAFGLGMLARKPKVVEKTVESTVERVTERATETATETAKNVTKRVSKKHRIKNTTPNRNPKPISNEREAEIVNNIETKYANNQSRKLADQAKQETVTREQQVAYDKEIAYQAPTAEQKRDLAILQSKNKAERAEKNAIENQVSEQEKFDLQQIKANSETEELIAKKLKDGEHKHPNNNTYFTKGGKIIKIQLKTGEVITNEMKIAKHLCKNNIRIVDLFSEKELEGLLAQVEKIKQTLNNAA